MKKNILKEYSNGEVTVIWKPDACIHSGNCVRGLSEVFNPKARPWINVEGADTAAIINQVKACPSGALSYYLNEVEAQEEATADVTTTQVEALKNGPLLVHGELNIKNSDGQEQTRSQTTAFCRCGASTNKPYCDGSHRSVNFEG